MEHLIVPNNTQRKHIEELFKRKTGCLGIRITHGGLVIIDEMIGQVILISGFLTAYHIEPNCPHSCLYSAPQEKAEISEETELKLLKIRIKHLGMLLNTKG